MRILLRLATVSAVFLGITVVHLPMSQAIEVPETLADRRPVGVGPVEPGFPIDHVGVLWETRGAAAEHSDRESEEHGAVRFRVDGAWTAWHPLTEDGAHAEGQWASALVPAGDAEAYQVRGIPAGAVAPRAVALNTTDGPLVEVGRRPAGGAWAVDNCVSRGEWKADESLRFDGQGNEIWPTEFFPVQTMTVHHTATGNGDPDPAATVRAIYRYHAVDRAWGDIGYHYLIDEQGRVYEGRWSGTASLPCSGGADGSDFAHDAADGLVTAGHTGGYNSGNMGAALLGDFTTHRKNGAQPAGPAVDALESLLAEFASRHRLDPHAVVDYVNPADPTATKTVGMISGHRDWTSTECPGERLYAQLPAIRDAVAAQVAALAVSITSPAEGASVRDTVTVTVDAPDATGVTFSVGGSEFAGTSTDGIWSFSWDTNTFAEGAHELTATATDTVGQRTSHSITVIVDNVAEPVILGVTGVAPDSGKQNTTVDVTITGTGFAADATVDLQNGEGTDPAVSAVAVDVDGETITATFTIGKTSGPRRDRPWDVVVTNPDGTSAALVGGFTVLR